MADGELAEPRNRHLTAGRKLRRDRVEHGVNGALGLANSESGTIRDLASELVLRHDTPLRWSNARSKLARGPDVQGFRATTDARIWARLRARRGYGRPIA